MKTKVTVEVIFDTDLSPGEAWALVEGWVDEVSFELEDPAIGNVIIQVAKVDQ